MTKPTTWKERFDQIDKAPWPGPRPIEEADQIHGRSADADVFLAAVLDHLLVVLTADSGVGKTSLLNGRLIPDLKGNGFRPVLIRQWHFEQRQDPGIFVAQAVVAELADAKLGACESESFWKTVDCRYGDRLVLVLDQFEELVRFQAGLFRRTRDWIANLNRDSRIRVVISLRAEYHHQLRDLERQARPFTMTTHRLEPISEDDDIKSVIDGVAPRYDVVETSVRDSIVVAWHDAQLLDDPPGLLHLQALLYVLYHRSRTAETPITAAGFSALRQQAGDAKVSLFDFALQLAVDLKLANCRKAAIDYSFDRVLVDGADALVRRIVPHLSSGGFKLVLDEWTLAKRALATEMAHSQIVEDELKDIYANVKTACLEQTGEAPVEVKIEVWPPDSPKLGERWLFGPRMARLEGGDERSYLLRDWVPWAHDARDMSSGPMLGMSPHAVMFQEFRRFAFAMAWLDVATLVRRSAPEPGRTMVALIHDGFGDALERGAGARRETFTQAMARLTGARGEELSWTAESIATFRLRDGRAPSEAQHLKLFNVRWRDCTVRAVEFVDLVFVNGDFRGSRFEDCSFRGVTFVNCLLDNALLARCVIEGRTGSAEVRDLDVVQLTSKGDRQLPDFLVDKVPIDERELLARYRDARSIGHHDIYSRTSGISVQPVPENGPPGISWTPAIGGLAVFGGRLSSLMLNGCTFRSEGTVALRHIAGAALDFVEHRGGRVEIVDSTIRGLTIAAPEPLDGVDVTTHDEERDDSTYLEVHTSVIANTWFDADLQGWAHFHDCSIAQLINCSPADQFAVEADAFRAENTPVGVVPDRATLDGAFKIATPMKPRPPMESFAAMDYRSQPARSELGGGLEGT